MDPRQRLPQPRPTDEEIEAVALAIQSAVSRPPPDDPWDDICSLIHELPPEDEAWVIAVLQGRLAGG